MSEPEAICVRVDLTFNELYRAAMVGVERQIHALKVANPGSLGIELTWDEVRRAASIGVMRGIHDLENGGMTEVDWALHINAALGECMVAKGLGTYWPGAVGDHEPSASRPGEGSDPS